MRAAWHRPMKKNASVSLSQGWREGHGKHAMAAWMELPKPMHVDLVVVTRQLDV